MLTDRGLAALRLAATVHHLHPTLVTRLRADGQTMVRVSAPCAWSELEPVDPDGGTVRELNPCGFRAATAKAWSQHRAGRRLRLLDIDTDPSIEVTPATGDCVWPSGIARVRSAELVTYVFGTFLAPDRCRTHGRDLLDAGPTPEGLLDLVLQRDSDTEVTVVSAEIDPVMAERAEPEVLELLESLLARFASIELLDELTPERTRP